MAAVVVDFDKIAAALGADDRERTLTRAERWLLRQVPPHAKCALDVGCGDGLLTRALAARGISTLGIDASPGMVALARRRARNNPRIEYRVADIMTDPLPEGRFDVVVSVSAVHHMALDEVLPRLIAAVAPGGTLLIQDVTTRTGLRGLPLNALAWCARRLRAAPAKAVTVLYEAHGADEQYLNERDVELIYRRLLPGSRVELHLEWRYTIVWERPGATAGASASSRV